MRDTVGLQGPLQQPTETQLSHILPASLLGPRTGWTRDGVVLEQTAAAQHTRALLWESWVQQFGLQILLVCSQIWAVHFEVSDAVRVSPMSGRATATLQGHVGARVPAHTGATACSTVLSMFSLKFKIGDISPPVSPVQHCWAVEA